MKEEERPEVKMYSDFKSPYAYLAFEPAFELEDKYRVRLKWKPFQLRLKGKGQRSQYSEYKVKLLSGSTDNINRTKVDCCINLLLGCQHFCLIVIPFLFMKRVQTISYLGGKRSPPSKRITDPFNMTFSTIC